MSAVMEKPEALEHVRLSNRVLVAMRGAGFHWYSAGLAANRRTYWMRKAREGDAAMRRDRVEAARYYHHEYMREIARALKFTAPGSAEVSHAP